MGLFVFFIFLPTLDSACACLRNTICMSQVMYDCKFVVKMC